MKTGKKGGKPIPPPTADDWANFRNITYFGRGHEKYDGGMRMPGSFGEPRWCVSNGGNESMAWNGEEYVLINVPCDALRPDAMSPQQAAEQAIARLSFTTPDVGFGPDPNNNRFGMLPVGFNVWFFPRGGTLQPASARDSVGGHEVNLSIGVKEITYQLGDGTILSCSGGGTPRPADLKRDIKSPDCGHQYEKKGEYTIVAMTTWQVDWTASGASGSQDITLSSSRSLSIGELHSVNR